MRYMIELKNVSFKYGSGKKDYNLNIVNPPIYEEEEEENDE